MKGFVNLLRDLSTVIHIDVCRHELWESEDETQCAQRIRQEVDEQEEAAGDAAHYREELADVVIIALSVAGHLGIDIGHEVARKMEINQKRTKKHK